MARVSVEVLEETGLGVEDLLEPPIRTWQWTDCVFLLNDSQVRTHW